MRKDCITTIRITHEEKDRWLSLCHKLDLDFSDFVRTAVRQYEQKITNENNEKEKEKWLRQQQKLR